MKYKVSLQIVSWLYALYYLNLYVIYNFSCFLHEYEDVGRITEETKRPPIVCVVAKEICVVVPSPCYYLTLVGRDKQQEKKNIYTFPSVCVYFQPLLKASRSFHFIFYFPLQPWVLLRYIVEYFIYTSSIILHFLPFSLSSVEKYSIAARGTTEPY